MVKVVIDSSVWVHFFQGEPFTLTDQVKHLIMADRAVICGAVEMELFSGSDKARKRAVSETFAELEYQEFNRKDFSTAAGLYREMRSRGKTLKQIDMLIAAFCIERGLILLSLDKDFDGIPGLERLRPNLP